MKLENSWRYKTIENLEKNHWSHHDYDSSLVRRIQELRKIPLNEFTTGDLRIMIGQQIGLDYLLPLALEALTQDIWVEGDLFPGDLLKSVLAVSPDFWCNNKDYWSTLHLLISNKLEEIGDENIAFANFISANPANK